MDKIYHKEDKLQKINLGQNITLSRDLIPPLPQTIKKKKSGLKHVYTGLQTDFSEDL